MGLGSSVAIVANVDGAEELKRRIAAGVDLVTFTSASSVSAFADAVGRDAVPGVPGASIGPITTAAARAIGVDVVVEARDSTIPGLASAIVEHFATEASA